MIRNETPADILTIRKLIYAAFKNHPHHEPGADPTEHDIVDRLREKGELSLSLVAEDNGQIVGHIAFSPVTVNGESVNWLGLAPVSVSPEYQGEGIGSKLIREGLAILKKQGVKGFVLLGDPGYYERFGFRPYSQLILPDVPAEYFMAISCDDEIPSGDVAYSAAFD